MTIQDQQNMASRESFNDISPIIPFKKLKGKSGVKFRQDHKRSDSKEGMCLDIEHDGHDHIHFDFRELYETTSGKQGNRRSMLWHLDTKSTVQLASILFHLAEEHMRDSSEEPYCTVVASKDRAAMGPNWVREDFKTAARRTELRKSRNELFGLMKRFIEACEDISELHEVAIGLVNWANNSKDDFAKQLAEKAAKQLDLQHAPESIG